MNRTLKTMNRFALVLKIEDSGSEACNPQIVTKIDRAEKFSDPYAGVIDDIALRGGAVLLQGALLQRMTAAADRRHCWRSGGEVEMMVEHFHSLGQGRWTYAESSLDQTHLSPDAGLNTPWAGLAFA